MMRKLALASILVVSFATNVFAIDNTTEPNWADLGLKVFNFVVFLILLKIFAAKPVATMLKNKLFLQKEQVKTVAKQSKELSKEVFSLERKLKNAQKDWQFLEEESIKETEILRWKVIQEAKEQAVRMDKQSEIRIEQAVFRAKHEIKQFMAKKAMETAEGRLKDSSLASRKADLLENYAAAIDKKVKRT